MTNSEDNVYEAGMNFKPLARRWCFTWANTNGSKFSTLKQCIVWVVCNVHSSFVRHFYTTVLWKLKDLLNYWLRSALSASVSVSAVMPHHQTVCHPVCNIYLPDRTNSVLFGHLIPCYINWLFLGIVPNSCVCVSSARPIGNKVNEMFSQARYKVHCSLYLLSLQALLKLLLLLFSLFQIIFEGKQTHFFITDSFIVTQYFL